MFAAKVIEHSTSEHGIELLTFQLVYPRFIHSELMTHRVFSRNAMSSRAVPVAKMIAQVRNAPAAPVHWGANQAGMQAKAQLEGDALEEVQLAWSRAAMAAAEQAEIMMAHGAHKQVANRILEPFQWMQSIVTATEWDNWNELRVHEDAEPNIFKLASMMKEAREASTPVIRGHHAGLAVNWHLPYVTAEERAVHANDPIFLAKISAARCARVSYLTHDGQTPDIKKDLDLYDRLVGSRPLHASPIEHQAYPMSDMIVGTNRVREARLTFSGNLRGWEQYRKQVEARM